MPLIKTLIISRVFALVVGGGLSLLLEKAGLKETSQATFGETFGGSIADLLKEGSGITYERILEQISQIDKDHLNHDLNRAARKAQLLATLFACRACLMELETVSNKDEEKRWVGALIKSLQERVNNLPNEIPQTVLKYDDIFNIFDTRSTKPADIRQALVKKLQEETYDLIRTDKGSFHFYSMSGFRLLEDKIKYGWEEISSPTSPIKRFDWFSLVCGCFNDEYKKPHVTATMQKHLQLEVRETINLIFERLEEFGETFEQLLKTITKIDETATRTEGKTDLLANFLMQFRYEDLTLLKLVLAEVLELRKDFEDANKNRTQIDTAEHINQLPKEGQEHFVTADGNQWKNLFRRILMKAIPAHLHSIDIFDRSVISNVLDRIHQDPSFKERIKISVGIDTHLITPTTSGFLGVLDPADKEALCKNDAIEIVLSSTLMGAAAILFYLKEVEHCNIQLNFRVAHSVEILSKIERREISPEACVVGDAQYIHIRNRELRPTYEVLTIMPPDKNYIVAPKIEKHQYDDKALQQGDYWLLKDDKYVSTVLFGYERYMREGIIPPNIKPKNLEPDEALASMQDGNPDSRHMLWSLQRIVAELLGVAVRIDQHGYPWDTLLICKSSFINERSGRRAQALSKAIRHAWIQLYKNPSVIERIIDVMLSDQDYVEIARRISGAARLGIR